MRILFICRLFSGFEDSLQTAIWNPKGAPTIAKLLEALDRDPACHLTLIMTAKGHGASWPMRDQIIHLQGLQTPIHVLAGKNRFPGWLWKFQEKLADLAQLLTIHKLYLQTKPDLIYCDRVNILPAALFSRFTKTPVIWRVMGVLEKMHTQANAKNWRARLNRWLWRSPFKAVICTLEGSGGGPWMDKVIAPGVPKHLLLNGIDKGLEPEPIPLPAHGIKVLFAGRLEAIKGANEFLTAMLAVIRQNLNFHAVFAGDGSLRQHLEHKVKTAGCEQNITFLGSLTPSQIRYVRQNCDLYVSLNTQGNLSNVNLEALQDGLPTIVPKSNPESGIDLDTDRLIPADMFYRFGKVGDTQALISAILKFEDETERAERKAKTKALANTLLKDWHSRIEAELKILGFAKR